MNKKMTQPISPIKFNPYYGTPKNPPCEIRRTNLSTGIVDTFKAKYINTAHNNYNHTFLLPNNSQYSISRFDDNCHRYEVTILESKKKMNFLKKLILYLKSFINGKTEKW